jgi:hypothetical protein
MATSPHTNGVYHATDEAIDSLYSWFPPQAPTPTPLPEAAFSLTLKGLLDGIEAMLTVRGQTATEFTANLAAVRGLLATPTPQPPTQASGAPQGQGKGWCSKHGVQMKLTQKDGCSWWAHKIAEGGWCKGK